MINKENVRLVRLLSGEEIVGEVIRGLGDNGNITLKHPYIVVAEQKQNGVNVGMYPWIVYKEGDETEVEIRGTSIVFVIPAHENFINQLTSLTSKLALPQNGKIQIAR